MLTAYKLSLPVVPLRPISNVPTFKKSFLISDVFSFLSESLQTSLYFFQNTYFALYYSHYSLAFTVYSFRIATMSVLALTWAQIYSFIYFFICSMTVTALTMWILFQDWHYKANKIDMAFILKISRGLLTSNQEIKTQCFDAVQRPCDHV